MSDSVTSSQTPRSNETRTPRPFLSVAPPKKAASLDFASAFGAILAWSALFGALLLEGGDLRSLVHLPAALLVFGGTLGAGAMSFRSHQVARIPLLLRKAFRERNQDIGDVIILMSRLADKARRTGLLSLEAEAAHIEEPLLQQSLRLVIDGTDPETIRDILLTDIHYQELRHRSDEGIFATLAGFAPTLGIIGTVMGLVHMLSNLNDPTRMGPLIAGAFMATLYGVLSANLIFLPISNKLRAISAEEILAQEIMLEGALAIQAGNNPRVVEERLKAYIAPRLRQSLEETRGGRFK